ncbi:hypothetical protein ACFWM0_03215 [Streptomyces sp. NPDC058405]|uniref:hypothetical protein n=1 Tax=Streptomyces sp. NPDC058405 TaxID=3346482 RepID=UPI003663BBDB
MALDDSTGSTGSMDRRLDAGQGWLEPDARARIRTRREHFPRTVCQACDIFSGMEPGLLGKVRHVEYLGRGDLALGVGSGLDDAPGGGPHSRAVARARCWSERTTRGVATGGSGAPPELISPGSD